MVSVVAARYARALADVVMDAPMRIHYNIGQRASVARGHYRDHLGSLFFTGVILEARRWLKPAANRGRKPEPAGCASLRPGARKYAVPPYPMPASPRSS